MYNTSCLCTKILTGLNKVNVYLKHARLALSNIELTRGRTNHEWHPQTARH